MYPKAPSSALGGTFSQGERKTRGVRDLESGSCRAPSLDAGPCRSLNRQAKTKADFRGKPGPHPVPFSRREKGEWAMRVRLRQPRRRRRPPFLRKLQLSWRWRSRPISRVLSWTVIPLGAPSPVRSSNLPGPDAGNVMRSLFGLAPGGVCRAGLLPGSRCALTAPFHPCRPAEAVLGGIFLLHFPSARAAQALPGTLPCGARTFLGIAGCEHPG